MTTMVMTTMMWPMMMDDGDASTCARSIPLPRLPRSLPYRVQPSCSQDSYTGMSSLCGYGAPHITAQASTSRRSCPSRLVARWQRGHLRSRYQAPGSSRNAARTHARTHARHMHRRTHAHACACMRTHARMHTRTDARTSVRGCMKSWIGTSTESPRSGRARTTPA